jgi:hypothetical protein
MMKLILGAMILSSLLVDTGAKAVNAQGHYDDYGATRWEDEKVGWIATPVSYIMRKI